MVVVMSLVHHTAAVFPSGILGIPGALSLFIERARLGDCSESQLAWLQSQTQLGRSYYCTAAKSELRGR
ncbi:hypothetical protein NL676_017736 [Syzygium grande]|nr:hypothetical protein NL676_017736 [Syzygium grande]